jgi:hypothetical protein
MLGRKISGARKFWCAVRRAYVSSWLNPLPAQRARNLAHSGDGLRGSHGRRTGQVDDNSVRQLSRLTFIGFVNDGQLRSMFWMRGMKAAKLI